MTKTPRYKTIDEMKQDKKYLMLIVFLEITHKDGEIIDKKEVKDVFDDIYFGCEYKTYENMVCLLKKYGVLTDYSEHEYILNKNKKPYYKFKQDNKIKQIYSTILNQYKDIRVIVWKINDLKKISYIIVEVDKKNKDNIIKLLNEKYKNNYTIISETIYCKNMELFTNKENVLIVKNLNVKAPLIKNDEGIYLPTIEKVMVDLFKDKLYEQYHGEKLKRIYSNILKNYNVNFRRLYSYAKIRGVKESIEKLIKS